mmetsp:Transcript_91936/g.274321  ORF Transcript_91936/g.274321 Transcript_91936/m.274321 type:complete len:259 (+) Transcript_91936:213-989(+)
MCWSASKRTRRETQPGKRRCRPSSRCWKSSSKKRQKNRSLRRSRSFCRTWGRSDGSGPLPSARSSRTRHWPSPPSRCCRGCIRRETWLLVMLWNHLRWRSPRTGRRKKGTWTWSLPSVPRRLPRSVSGWPGRQNTMSRGASSRRDWRTCCRRRPRTPRSAPCPPATRTGLGCRRAAGVPARVQAPQEASADPAMRLWPDPSWPTPALNGLHQPCPLPRQRQPVRPARHLRRRLKKTKPRGKTWNGRSEPDSPRSAWSA